MTEKMKSTYFTGSLPVDPSFDKQLAQRKENIECLYEEIVCNEAGFDLTDIMDCIEKIISCCGGENKPTFLEVHRDMIRVYTRVPLQANLYQFIPESHESNVKFHRKVTELCLLIKKVHGVRWMQVESGCHLILTLKM